MQEQDPPMFNKFIFDECFIFILLIQFHLHLISFHQRFPHHLHNIFFQNFKKAPGFCQMLCKKYSIFTCLHFQCSHYNIPNF